MGFSDAISACFAKYATFSGRAVRSEYWYWVLFNVLAAVVFMIVQAVGVRTLGSTLSLVFDLATLIPSIAVAARRLHDTDRSGWWQLLAFVPVIGWIILLVWYCQPGTPAANRYA